MANRRERSAVMKRNNQTVQYDAKKSHQQARKKGKKNKSVKKKCKDASTKNHTRAVKSKQEAEAPWLEDMLQPH